MTSFLFAYMCKRYDVALGINTSGAINVLNFAKKCVKPQLLLHVSTGESFKLFSPPNSFIHIYIYRHLLIIFLCIIFFLF